MTTEPIVQQPPACDARSAAVIATLLPEVRPYALKLMELARAAGITIKVISGLRTYQEQDVLYSQGRSAPGSIVTHAKGGESNHNFGIAFDVGIFEGDAYVPESPNYATVGALGEQQGLEWGGAWTTLRDEPHFELRPDWAKQLLERDMLAQLRVRHSDGEAVYT